MDRPQRAHVAAVQRLHLQADQVGMIEFIVLQRRQGRAGDVKPRALEGLGLVAGQVFGKADDETVLHRAPALRGQNHRTASIAKRAIGKGGVRLAGKTLHLAFALHTMRTGNGGDEDKIVGGVGHGFGSGLHPPP